jgi:hypothetical protein
LEIGRIYKRLHARSMNGVFDLNVFAKLMR